MKNFILLVTVVAFVGCASSGRKLDQAKIDQIKKGETTKQQVLQWLGSPDQMTKGYEGETTFSYMYVHAQAKATSFIPVVGAFAGGADVKQQMLMVTFNPDGIVKGFISTYGATESGTGINASSDTTLSGVQDDKRPK